MSSLIVSKCVGGSFDSRMVVRNEPVFVGAGRSLTSDELDELLVERLSYVDSNSSIVVFIGGSLTL